MRDRVALSVFALILVLGIFLAVSAKSPVSGEAHGVPLSVQHGSTHSVYLEAKLGDETKQCSATAVGHHALLIAGHCLVNTNEIFIDQRLLASTIYWITPDGNDHDLLSVSAEFKEYANISERDMTENEPVYMWGNPGHAKDVYRNGSYVDTAYDDETGTVLQRFALPVYPGDSGSGIFDAEGNVVAVVSMANESAETYALPLAFTNEQLISIHF